MISRIREVSCLIYECKEGGEDEGVNIGQVDRWLVRQLWKELSKLNEMRCLSLQIIPICPTFPNLNQRLDAERMTL